VVAVGYVTRFRQNVRFLGELLQASYFGPVRRFVHQFGTVGGWSPMSSYHLNRRSVGGGVLVVTGTHFLDRMLHYWGYPDELSYRDDSNGGPEANCVATMLFNRPEGAIFGTARYSKTTNLPKGLAIETDEGVIVLRDTTDANVLFRPRSSPTIEYTIAPRRGHEDVSDVFLAQVRDFVNACRTGRRPLVDAEQGLRSLDLLENFYGRRTPLDSDWYQKTAGVSVVA
jgi:predicted dehydrogenase